MPRVALAAAVLSGLSDMPRSSGAATDRPVLPALRACPGRKRRGVIRTADDARLNHLQPAPNPERGSTAARVRHPRQHYVASIAFATPDCISCAFITGEKVMFAPKPMK